MGPNLYVFLSHEETENSFKSKYIGNFSFWPIFKPLSEESPLVESRPCLTPLLFFFPSAASRHFRCPRRPQPRPRRSLRPAEEVTVRVEPESGRRDCFVYKDDRTIQGARREAEPNVEFEDPLS